MQAVTSIDDIRKRCAPIINDTELAVVSWASLFGSFAKGKQTEDSDVDILVGYSKDATSDDIYYTEDVTPQRRDVLGRDVDCSYLQHGWPLEFGKCLAILDGKLVYGSEQWLADLRLRAKQLLLTTHAKMKGVLSQEKFIMTQMRLMVKDASTRSATHSVLVTNRKATRISQAQSSFHQKWSTASRISST